MNFEEFKKRYMEQMRARGYMFGVDVDEDQALEDQMSAVYLGLSVYANFQNEQAIKHIEEMERQKQTAQSGIIVTGKGH